MTLNLCPEKHYGKFFSPSAPAKQTQSNPISNDQSQIKPNFKRGAYAPGRSANATSHEFIDQMKGKFLNFCSKNSLTGSVDSVEYRAFNSKWELFYEELYGEKE
jgi:hypothetical protein